MTESPEYSDANCEQAFRALGLIIESGALGETSRLRQLLHYLVVEELEGRGERLKAYSIATDVFGRGEGFDPGVDSIVRVEVHRLRQALDHYYATKGGNDPLRIDVPKGTYRPVFTPQQPDRAAAVPASPGGSSRLAQGLRKTWPGAALFAVLLAGLMAWGLIVSDAVPPAGNPDQLGRIPLKVLPFTAVSDDERPADLAVSLREEIVTGLSRVKAINVLRCDQEFSLCPSSEVAKSWKDRGLDYALRGSVQRFHNTTRLVVQLLDARSGSLLWAQSYNGLDESTTEHLQFVSDVVSELRSRVFNAAKQDLQPQDAKSLDAWQLYIQSTWVPGTSASSLAWEKERVALAERALALRPDFGQAHSVLADKLVFLGNVGSPGKTAEMQRQAQLHARRAVELAPADPDVMFNISLYHWHSGQLRQAIETINRVLELDPSHALARVLAEAMPFACTAPPQDVLHKAITYDSSLSPDNPIRSITLEWIALLHMNAGEFRRAVEAGQRSIMVLQTPQNTVRQAAVLHHLGQTAEALTLIEDLRDRWPGLDLRHYFEMGALKRCSSAPAGLLHRTLFNGLADVVERNPG